MDKEEIVLCPFCGTKDNEVWPDLRMYRVACHKCAAAGPLKHTERQAIKAWNTRA